MSARPIQRVGVLWPRLGPYHLARLRAAHAWFKSRGVEVVAIETAGNDQTYDWSVESRPEAFRREQVFPEAIYEDLSPRATWRGVTALLDELNLDGVAITSYSTSDAQAALWWCRRRRRVAVCMLASKADDADRATWREWLKSQIVQQFDAALAGGSPQTRYLLDLGLPSERVFTPYNAVDNAHFRERCNAIRATGPPSSVLPGLAIPSPFFLSVGRMIGLKNLPRLVEAYAAYRDLADDPWRLVLVGEGPERESIERLVRERGIRDVTIAGFQQIDTLPEYYARASAFVHPAHQEPWGLVLNEAMASGLPVIVSDRIGAAEDLVTHDWNGYLFDPSDVSALTNCLLRMSALPNGTRAAMAARSRQRVAEWSPERFAEGLWSAFRAGRGESDRPMAWSPRILIAAQRWLAPRSDSFHALRS